MAKRKKIGLVYTTNNAQNSGVVNYLFSLIKALNTLEDARKPKLVIFHTEISPIDIIKAENYPYIKFHLLQYPRVPIDIFSRLVNKPAKWLTGEYLIVKNVITAKDAEYVFPYFLGPWFENIPNKVSWLVDFNPYYFKDHLSADQRNGYFENVKKMVYGTHKVVLSSYDIFNDLKKFHPDYTCKVEILRFAAMLPPYQHVQVQPTKGKFGIDKPYFMTPNQFWVHKNHMVMLKAAALLKKQGFDFQLVFTGNTNVEHESNYYPNLLAFVNEHQLDENVKFLGLVDRAEQLTLMKHSVALVQPSLFEGWSTLVEESKALHKHMVVSDLPIHREQISVNCTFFDPHNEEALAEIMSGILTKGADMVPYDYNQDIRGYAERILEIFS